ncbi:hypothetical protein, conserved [Trypanosoma brucei brucei TREU927]|uniref:Uncharacterized protein n=1 Tax=Trypanosoma brucei brucei (strain 927/4 GUTat10.1) TaxID=185431 RepID=Q38B12_TRYB2|nr:hypothetical protein, conserved [Trypanosoma brucei brucei TREU927]EAN78008.1 hypothetical protein, conserved [Trypanosoma brucei brucei TREU927]
MGVPDFLKFVSRTAPGALCRLPRDSVATPLCFDFILIDATNAAQTIGLEVLGAFLRRSQVQVRQAVIFAVDGQRQRSDTARAQRTHSTVLDTDVVIQRFGSDLQRHYEQCGGESVPQVLISGRHVAGEADYKILDIQRFIIMQVFTNGGSDKLPTFCMVSEDSDVLCGALCGPAPHTVSIVTKLRDTMIDMCVLRVSHVLAHVGVCMEAFISGAETSVEEEKDMTVDSGPVGSTDSIFHAEQMETEGDGEEQITRRKKVDGPMVSTGVRVVLGDSDDDDDHAQSEGLRDTRNGGGNMDNELHPPKAGPSTCVPTMVSQAAVAEILQNSCVDMVFLFIIVMGNGGSVPPVIRGATKVDIQSCWRAYCKMKYNTAESEREKEMGRTLFDLNGILSIKDQQSDDIASVVVDCSFLCTLLDTAQYADVQSRPMTDEDKERALLYLSHAAYAALRYIVACNVGRVAAGRVDDTFLDTRNISEVVSVPSVAAFLSVLNQTKKRTLHFPLVGSATTDVLSSAAKGVSAVEEAITAARIRSGRGESRMVLQTDVAGTLASAVTASGAQRCVQLSRFLAPFTTAEVSRKNIMDCLKHSPRNYSKISNSVAEFGGRLSTFSRLLLAWRRTIELCVPTLGALAGKETATSTLGAVAGDEGKGVAALSSSGLLTTGRSCAKMSYSFELRRMAPVLVSEQTNHKSNAATDATRRDILFKALRISHDYVEAPQIINSKSKEPELSSSGDVDKKCQLERKRHREGETLISEREGASAPGKRHRTQSVKDVIRSKGKNKKVKRKKLS